MKTKTLAAVAAAAAATSVVVGCGDSDGGSTTGTGRGTEMTQQEVRHDLDPLKNHFPIIRQPKTASWLGGTLGDDNVPGPSIYYVDAVVDLEPSVAGDLRTRYTPTDAGAVPQLRAPLQAPAGGFLTSPALDQAVGGAEWHAKAFLHNDTLVITATGD